LGTNCSTWLGSCALAFDTDVKFFTTTVGIFTAFTGALARPVNTFLFTIFGEAIVVTAAFSGAKAGALTDEAFTMLLAVQIRAALITACVLWASAGAFGVTLSSIEAIVVTAAFSGASTSAEAEAKLSITDEVFTIAVRIRAALITACALWASAGAIGVTLFSIEAIVVTAAFSGARAEAWTFTHEAFVAVRISVANAGTANGAVAALTILTVGIVHALLLLRCSR